MAIRILKYSISFLLLIAVNVSYAQEKIDTLKADYLPTGLRVGVDAFALGQTFASDHIDSKLFVADIDFHRYFLVGEYGRYERTRSANNGSYTTNGTYWRIGADVNFFKYENNSVFSLGLRYGRSTFDDQFSATIDDGIYGPHEVSYSNIGLDGDWFELVLGLKVPVWKLWLGYNLRLKLGIDSYDNLNFSPYEVPGYGLAAEKDFWEFNYYLMYRIEWGE